MRCSDALRLKVLVRVLSDARSSNPVNVLSRLPISNELSKNDKVEEDGTQATYEPGGTLDQVVSFDRFEQDTGYIRQVTSNCKDEQCKRKTFTLRRSVLENLRYSAGQIEQSTHPAIRLCIPAPSDSFVPRISPGMVSRAIGLGDIPCSNTSAEYEEGSERVHEDLSLDGAFFLLVAHIFLDNAAVRD